MTFVVNQKKKSAQTCAENPHGIILCLFEVCMRTDDGEADSLF